MSSNRRMSWSLICGTASSTAKEVRGLAAGKAAHVKAAIRLDYDQPFLCQYADCLAERGSTHPLLVDPSAARQFPDQDETKDFFVDPFAQRPFEQFFWILYEHKRRACQPAHLGLRMATPQPSAE
jgi:hypothetical protein